MTEEELEAKIEKVYRQASEELTQKLTDYMEQFAQLDEKFRAEVASGERTQEDYLSWRTGKIMTGERWLTMRNQLSSELLDTNNTARDMINDYLPEACAEGVNFASYQVSTAVDDASIDASFTLYDRNAVENLIKNEPTLLPQLNPESETERQIREGRILRWDNQKITSQVTQGLLQGESMDKVAKRMENVVGMDKNSAIRNARTSVNSAQNAGREIGYERAESLGIEMEQVWLASLDDKTRYEHRQLDGQHVKVGEKFKVDGYELAYPCDPSGAPEMVYNCRCTTVPYFPKYDNAITLEERNTSKMTDESYEAWKEGHKTKSDTEETTSTTTRGSSSASTASTDRTTNTVEPTKETVSEAKTFEPATDRWESYDLLRDVGFEFDEFQLDNVSEKLLVENANQLATLDSRFGIVGDREIRVGHFTGEIEGAYAGVDPVSGNLLINTDYFSNARTMKDAIRDAIKPDEDGRADTMSVSREYYGTAVITHEYGHMLQQNIYESMGGSKFEEVDGEMHLTVDYLQWTKEVADEIFTIAVRNNPDKTPEELWAEQGGIYAETDTQEFFAECFMNALCGASNSLGDAMLQWLEERGY